MAENSSSHQRNKSSIAKSLLSKVTSRGDAPHNEAPDSPATDNLEPSSPTMASGRTSFQSVRPTPHLVTTMTNNNPDSASATSPPSRSPQAPRNGSITTMPQGSTTSIEQSVKLFKVFEALRQGDTAAINKHLREDSTRLEGNTILHLAVQCAEPSVVEYVLSMGQSTLDVNARDRDGNTPLHIASSLGRTSVIKLLLDQPQINESTTNFQGKTPLDQARSPDAFQLLQLARSLFIDRTTKRIQHLVQSADYGTLEDVLADDHVRHVVDINAPELATEPQTVESGGTLLHEATRKKDTQLIQILLLNGADPFRRDRKGKLPQEITKDDHTKQILKKSPAAAAAQRGVQEKAILGTGEGPPENALSAKEAREMKGYLKKWTNYTSGYKLRWFVLEDGVLSYYKHQDDAGSACRGAINMKIASLHMDSKDKLTFEIHGKSSVKYHLKANHEVEAKRWFWSLNNAIQWSKDEAREEQKRQRQEGEALRQAAADKHSGAPSVADSSTLAPTVTSERRTSIARTTDGETLYGDESSRLTRAHTFETEGERDLEDEEDDYGDDDSSHDIKPINKDAFNITAQSAKLQLDLLASVSNSLQQEKVNNPTLPLGHPDVEYALTSYDTAVGNLRGLLIDLLRLSKDHDAYWQHRVDREAHIRKLWEESMARVAAEQEELENRIGESEDKRKRTKRALRDALEGQGSGTASRARSRRGTTATQSSKLAAAVADIPVADDGTAVAADTASLSRRQTLADLTNHDVSDDESDMDEQFFDAVDAGEVEVVGQMPVASTPQTSTQPEEKTAPAEDNTSTAIQKSYKGYEDPVRSKLPIDADNRPKVSLWGILKNMIGKDMTKMTLPVTFNEPTSLLYRVVEDMQYTELLDTAAERSDSAERMVYVAGFAASEYASTIGRVAKPFNPLLGETFEYVRPDKGYRFFIEQVSHHPPVGAAYAESAKWEYYGESSVKSKFYGKSFEINPLGTWFLRLKPTNGSEELYTWKKITSSVVGIITGSPTIDNYGLMEVKNHTTGETAILDFKQRGWKASSAFLVAGKVTDAKGVPKWSIGGRWNDKIYARPTPGYEDENLGTSTKSQESNQAILVWEAGPRPAGIPFNLTPFVITLNALPSRLQPLLAPTDSRFRPDQRAMEEGKYDVASDEKNRVEEKQRARRREREAAGEHFEPRWFKSEKHPITGEEYWKFGGEYWGVRDKVANGEVTWKEAGLEEIY
ncbi:hypothetical protein D6C84_02670 [Aureobasidium pullulans]|uniref:PH domain-containing protein n=1 Tax=Aureobasidium pullulans TaxID=5580 RepID=A0A4S9Y3N4_AURPU|nr:hypothetical protein D6C84_02670 [Aureobasidium pullulans]